jgi:hypothetical protein
MTALMGIKKFEGYFGRGRSELTLSPLPPELVASVVVGLITEAAWNRDGSIATMEQIRSSHEPTVVFVSSVSCCLLVLLKCT